MTEISKEQFEAYVDVQESGVTNMFDVKTVGQLSGLEKEQIMKIMTDYGTLKENIRKYEEKKTKQSKSKIYGQKLVKREANKEKSTQLYN